MHKQYDIVFVMSPNTPNTRVSTAELFAGFDMAESSDNLTLGAHGFFMGDAFLYGIRKARAGLGIENPATDLFNGRIHTDGSLPTLNSTEGSGLYIANTPQAAERVASVTRGKYDLYAIKVAPPIKILDALQREPQESRDQERAARWLRMRGIIPAVPGPGSPFPGQKRTRHFDRLYEGADFVAFPPLAMARPAIGYKNRVGSERIAPRWGIVRGDDLSSKVTIIGKRPGTK